MATAEDIRRSFKKVLLKDVETVHDAPKKVVCLKNTASLEHALSVLSTNNIMSAPVFADKECLGILDCLDIVGGVTRMMDQAKQAKQANSEGYHHNTVETEYIQRPPEYWLKMAGKLALQITKTQDVINIQARDPFVTLMEDDSITLLDVIRFFATGMHRVAILNSENRIVRIFSQSAAIAHLCRNPDLLGSFADKTLAEVGLAPPMKVVKVPAHIAALDAFRALISSGVSGVALVEDTGRLIGVLESTDLKRLTAARIQDLTKPTLEFLEDRRRGVKDASWCHSVKRECTIKEVIQDFHDHHVHRLFATDADGKPVGVVSFSDVVAVLIGQATS